MGTDLHSPLGQNRAPGRKTSAWLSKGRLFAGVCLIGIAGLSIYAMRPTETLKRPSADETALATRPETKPADTAGATPTRSDTETGADAGKDPSGLPLSGSRSGANVERTMTGDGTVVTKFTPGSRDGKGPVLIDATTVGQDARMAATPNDALLEETPEGRLPIVGPDGLRPVDQYARPWSGARGTRVAIVVGGLGLSQTGTQRAIKQLPEEVTLAFAASGNSLQRWMQDARRSGHEILLQVPLEPFDYPDNDPGPETLLISRSPDRNLVNLHKAMGKITNYTGVMNYLGGRFLSDTDAMDPVMRDIAGRGLLFLDDGSSAQSQSGIFAKTLEMPHAFADVQLDGQLQVSAILAKLDELERIARRNGTAIGVASAFDESITAIRQWSDEASLRGIEIVGVSALANEKTGGSR